MSEKCHVSGIFVARSADISTEHFIAFTTRLTFYDGFQDIIIEGTAGEEAAEPAQRAFKPSNTHSTPEPSDSQQSDTEFSQRQHQQPQHEQSSQRQRQHQQNQHGQQQQQQQQQQHDVTHASGGKAEDGGPPRPQGSPPAS